MNTTTEHSAATEHPAADYYPPPESGQAPPGSGSGPRTPTEPLSRPLEGRILGGVGGALARYLHIDVTLVRIVLAVLAIAGGAGVPLYLAGWLLIPEEGHEQSMAAEFIESWADRSHGPAGHTD